MLSPPSHPNLQQRIKASARRWSKGNNKLIIDKWQLTIIFLHLKRNAKKILHPPQRTSNIHRNNLQGFRGIGVGVPWRPWGFALRITLRNHKNHFDIRHSMLSSQTAWWQPWNEVLHYEPYPMFAPGKTACTPWQKGLSKKVSAKGIRIDNVYVMCIDRERYSDINPPL